MNDTVNTPDLEHSRKVAIMFDEPQHCAVLDVDKLAQGDIAFGSNSWRGDRFEQSLRKAILDDLNHEVANERNQP